METTNTTLKSNVANRTSHSDLIKQNHPHNMSQVFQWKPIRGPLRNKFKQNQEKYVKNFINSNSLDYIKGPMLRFASKLRNSSNLLNTQPTPDTMACCATSFCGFPTCSTGGIYGSNCCQSSCCQPSCCETSCFQPRCCETGYGIGGGIGCGQEGGSGAVNCRVRWCRPDCRVEGTCLPPCCVVSCTPPTCCQLHHAQASCCRPSYCGQSSCRPACCCYCC